MSEVLEVQVVPSEEVNKVPDVPTATNETLEVVVLLSSLLLQEMTVRLIMVMRIIMKMLNGFYAVIFYHHNLEIIHLYLKRIIQEKTNIIRFQRGIWGHLDFQLLMDIGR